MKWLIKLAINVLTLMVVATVLPGFQVASWWTAIVAAVVIGLFNTLLKPILIIITLPVTIVTFGIFALILNVILLRLAAVVVPGFVIDGWITAFVASVLLSLISWFLSKLVKS